MWSKKTVSKKSYRSSYLGNETTAKEENKRLHQSQKLPQEVVIMQGEQGPQQFIVYQDKGLLLGSQMQGMPLIRLTADEDCKTTSSIREFGLEICQRDLQRAVPFPREQTQTALSDYHSERTW